jgi:hypothetical protein
MSWERGFVRGGFNLQTDLDKSCQKIACFQLLAKTNQVNQAFQFSTDLPPCAVLRGIISSFRRVFSQGMCRAVEP